MKLKSQTYIRTRTHTALARLAATEFEPTNNYLVKEHSTSLASLAKCLSVHLRTKWLWVRIPLQLLNYLIFRHRACFEQGVP